jgi:hypothetical protein
MALVASANVAHAGLLRNTAKLGKDVVAAEKFILKTPLTARQRLGFQRQVVKGTAKCLVKAATSNPC